MDKATLLTRIREAHARLADAARALDDAALQAPAPGMEGWTRKDVLAHVGWWSDHSTCVIEALRAGREPYDQASRPGIDDLNAQILAEHRDETASEVRRAEAEAYERLVAAVEAASEDELFRVGRFPWLEDDEPLAETVEWDSTRHYAGHLEQLRD